MLIRNSVNETIGTSSNGKSVAARQGSARWLWVCAIAASFAGCGDDQDGDDGTQPRDAGREATAGSSGSGGSGGGGNGGTSGTSGNSGTGGQGGSSGAPDASDAGRDARPDVSTDADASGASCGDGIKTAGEQCDDSNTTASDGCSPTCTLEACDQCRRTKCVDSCVGDAASGCSPSVITYRECPGLSGDAGALASGCSSILRCFRESGCDRDDPRGCYCGDVAAAQCFRPFPPPPSPPNGPCKAIIDTVVNPESVIDLAAKYLNPTGNPVGPAVQGVICERRECASECLGISPEADGGDAGDATDASAEATL